MRSIPKTVFTLGIVSFLTDISSEMVYPLVPIFMKDVLRAPVLVIGLVEAVAEATASLLKVVSGYISDRLGKRKALAVVGYGLSSVTKPILGVAHNWGTVFGVRFTDRFGKGIRTSPRDALIADVTEGGSRGKAFGFHRGMDTAGAVLGPLAAYLFLRRFSAIGGVEHAYRSLFFLAAVPAILGVIILAAFVKEPKTGSRPAQLPKIRFSGFDRKFKLFLLVVTLFSIGNSSDVFLILRARNLGVAAENVLLIYVAFNIVQAILAVPIGSLSDRIGRRPVIVMGYLIFAAVYVGFALAKGAMTAWVLFLVYGVYYACTESVQRAYAADLSPVELRGTAIGAYHTFVGLALLPASMVAGVLWDKVNPAAPFIYGASTALLAAVLLSALLGRGGEQKQEA